MIIAAICDSYKLELLTGGVHQSGDNYKIALYTSAADLSKLTEEYTTDAEVSSGAGYSEGGMDLEGFDAAISGDQAFITWTTNPVWPTATITAAGALIYNNSRGNKALCVLDFGGDVSSTNGPFSVRLPDRVITVI